MDSKSDSRRLSQPTRKPELRKHPVNLVMVKGKWYGETTVPVEIRGSEGFKNKQKRLSLSTSDKRIAQQRLHAVASELYHRMDIVWHGETFHAPDAHPLIETLMIKKDAKERGDLETYYTTTLESVTKAMSAETDKLSSFVERYFQTRKFTSIKTEKTARTGVAQYIAFCDPSIHDIRMKHAVDYAEHLQNEKGAAQKTIKSKLSWVNQMLEFLVDIEELETNPWINHGKRTGKFGAAQVDTKEFKHSDIRKIIDGCTNERDKLALQLIAGTGARLDEICTLKHSQIIHDYEGTGATVIDLRDSVVKNKGSARVIPLHPSLASLIGSGDGPLFDYNINADGKTTKASEYLMKHVRKITKDPKLNVRSLRHNFKTMCRATNIPEYIFDAYQGHSNDSEGKKYGHVPLEAMIVHINKLDLSHIA